MIAIIGAGMTGASAAQVLTEAGVDFTVFDKSRGLGGRLATRRTDSYSFDHGAPEITIDDDAFRSWLLQHADGALEQNSFRRADGMSGAVGPVFEDVSVHRATRIVALRRDGLGWALSDEAGQWFGPFEAVIVTIPAPQAQALCPPEMCANAFDQVVMRPVWTLLAGGTVPDTMLNGCDAPSVIPGRSHGNTGLARIYHFPSDFSALHIERHKPEMAQTLWARIAPDLPQPDYLAAHKWRYGRVGMPLGRPFHGTAKEGLLFGGDWALGDSAAHAWRSGQAMAKALLSR
ncbi:MAG: NAD(P)-binding protein [Rhodobacteraceae bacterium]|nr:NAD(P)-binding protein [Paracoccaceae bacterium]